jgi:uncharacterized phiE125 gp8 family phage protein
MNFCLISEPELEPVTIDDAAVRVGQIEGEEEFLLSCLLVAARAYLEGEVGRVFIDQTWSVLFEAWPVCGYLALPSPLAPVRKLESVRAYCGDELINLDLKWIGIDASGDQPKLVIEDVAAWRILEDANDEILVEVTAGYGPAPQDVPEPLRAAVLELAAH